MENKEKIEYDEDVRKLVAARLETLPDGAVVSVGSEGEFTKEQIIESVLKGDEIGQKMVEIEMSFLQSLKEGVLYGGTSADN
jgi:hypothetical protein